jgi:hypothetical protein
VWLQATDHDRVQQLKAALMREQALALAASYPPLTLPEEERRAIAAQLSPTAATANFILLARNNYTVRFYYLF